MTSPPLPPCFWEVLNTPGFIQPDPQGTCNKAGARTAEGSRNLAGQAVACGYNKLGQCNIPSLKSWREWFGFAYPTCRYVCDFKTFPMLGKDRVVQVDFLLEGDTDVILTCVGLDGLEVLRLKAQRSDRAVDVCSHVARELNTNAQSLRLVLPDGSLLASISKANPLSTLSDVISTCDRNNGSTAQHFFGEIGSRFASHVFKHMSKCPWICWRVVQQCWLYMIP